MRTINALVACEESQAICKELRARGWNAYSCDLQDCSGGHPEWHIKGDVLRILNGTGITFQTCDGMYHGVNQWDFVMAHPPCTYLAHSGNRCLNPRRYGEKYVRERYALREEGAEFFMKFTDCDARFLAIENPLGVMSTRWRQPDQIIHPWMWGDMAIKSTCLWTKNLPSLVPDITEVPEDMPYHVWKDRRTGKEMRVCSWVYETSLLRGDERRKMRSKTFPGIAHAIATQWGEYIEKSLEA